MDVLTDVVPRKVPGNFQFNKGIKLETYNVPTRKGAIHQFTVIRDNSGDSWNDVPGLYMFCEIRADGSLGILYVGKAKSFRDRFSNHSRWDEARRRGADRTLALLVRDESIRDQWEKDLIETYTPPMNEQYNPIAGFQSDTRYALRSDIGLSNLGFTPQTSGPGLINSVRRGLLDL